MSNTAVFESSGVVVENLPNTIFRVKITASQKPELVNSVVLCTLSGKMRINWVRLLPGDKVKCDVPALDLAKGRITYKLK
ncbi:translation initiation factor IF-1 [Candidatus Amesbacteria bacterium RIFCSPHIGHO2_02_FULL_47_9]|uniref:Translation initiation factor IF-1 n=1 Tax=Candidatus Amesbacteria bacterium RIFCSPHIGHO2_01_FULL_48_32b TaxID=1797253 RepID=A0A1F4YGI8_9BACT|nr:MAG: translation initiation factor IF-1 [Candidatus Amesbacteria bacterium RIFCSPHIGHO2_01_FULL_48_32b]OGD04607.1 MAG: translation initiation factor IF-1 [Candidatus Amesbacteria bacterium RIFCSPHIGHO2_02_FULL_47_9]